MSGRFLLDTNVVIRLLEGDVSIQHRIAAGARVVVPPVVMGELYFGALNSTRIKDNLGRINRFLTQAVVLECNVDTAYEYGVIRSELRNKGRPIPENDVWIAASARQNQLPLVSRDAHFACVDGLSLERW